MDMDGTERREMKETRSGALRHPCEPRARARTARLQRADPQRALVAPQRARVANNNDIRAAASLDVAGYLDQ